MEALITQMRRRDGKEGRLRSARTCAYEKQTEFSEEKESVFIDKNGKRAREATLNKPIMIS